MNQTLAPLIIGFGHKARQGKGTVVQTIIDYAKDKYDIRSYGFGDELKKEVNQVDQFEACMKAGLKYDFTPPMDDPLCPTKHGKQSVLLQWWGAMRRKQDPFYWVKKVATQITKDQPRVVLIHDVRYKNEFAFISSLNGFLVKVSRHGFIDLTRDPRHISETDLENTVFPFEINVLDGELDQLKKDAVTCFDMIVDFVTPKPDDPNDLSEPVTELIEVEPSKLIVEAA